MNPNEVFGHTDDQVNGDILTVVEEGEVYDDTATCLTFVPADFVVANWPPNFAPIDNGRHKVHIFIATNIHFLTLADPDLNLAQAAHIAYLRFLAVKYGLMSPSYTLDQIHSKYNQCVSLADHTCAHIAGENDDIIPQDMYVPIQAAMRNELTSANRRLWNRRFYNLVCLVAYMFRSRGHHFQQDYIARYNSLWQKTQTHEIGDNFNWLHISRYALHAIPPVVLDEFWKTAAERGMCDGTLVLRYNCKAAGTAVYGVVQSGVNDIKLVFPKVLDLLEKEVEHIEIVNEELQDNRWRHSVNARYYGERRDRLNENAIGAVGSFIRAMMDTLAAESPLLQSPALIRIAKIAPITGAVYARTIREYISSEEFRKAIKLS